MNCPKCSANVSDDALFCNACGSSVNHDKIQTETNNGNIMETMKIPVVKPSEIQKEEPPVQITHEKPQAVSAKPTKKKSDSGKNVLIFCLVFLITVVIGLSAVLAVVVLTNRNTENSAVNTQQAVSSNPPVSQKPVVQEKEIVVPEEGNSEGVEEKYAITVDSSFDFAHDVEFELPEIEHKTLSSSEYGYECSVPSDFVFVSESGGEIRYKAENHTAYMDIGACVNSEMQNSSSLKNMICNKLDAATEFYETDEEGFVLRCIRDSVVYHYKCFVDDYVRYIEFVYPVEYRDIYESYFADLETYFIKTN